MCSSGEEYSSNIRWEKKRRRHPERGRRLKENHRPHLQCLIHRSKRWPFFFKYLPYWKDLDFRHPIDGLHLQKNLLDSTLGLLMYIAFKTKDGLRSQRDLQDMGNRDELHPQDRGNEKYCLPPASYNLTQDEIRAMCQVPTRD